MGLIRILPRRATSRLALMAACALLPLLASGCKEIKDVGEELGWIKQEDAPLPVEVNTLDSHWIPADTVVAGVGQAQWSERWWQWVARAGAEQAPYLDPDGSRCAQHQDQGPVWFLAGTDGKFEAVRNCRIPTDRHLFVPLINWVVTRDIVGEMSCAEKQAQVGRFADHVVSGLVLLDGRPVGELKRMRVASGGCFAAPDGLPGASDGYWLMLKPLPPGKHQLAIAAAFRDGPRQMIQNFRYELEVEGAPAAAGAVQ
jgi:hypothetical protein